MEKIPVFCTFLLEFNEKQKSRTKNIRLLHIIHLSQIRSIFHQRIVCGRIVNIAAKHLVEFFIRHDAHPFLACSSLFLLLRNPLGCDGKEGLRWYYLAALC